MDMRMYLVPVANWLKYDDITIFAVHRPKPLQYSMKEHTVTSYSTKVQRSRSTKYEAHAPILSCG